MVQPRSPVILAAVAHRVVAPIYGHKHVEKRENHEFPPDLAKVSRFGSLMDATSVETFKPALCGTDVSKSACRSRQSA